MDKDRVCASNINRQIIATNKTIGRLKVEVMRERILDINPGAAIEISPIFITIKRLTILIYQIIHMLLMQLTR